MKPLSHTYTLYKRIIPTFLKLKDKNNSISWREKRFFFKYIFYFKDKKRKVFNSLKTNK